MKSLPNSTIPGSASIIGLEKNIEGYSIIEGSDLRVSLLEKLGKTLKATGCRIWKAGIPLLLFMPKSGQPPYLALADIRIMIAEGCHPARPGYTLWIEGAEGHTCIAGWAGEAEVRTTLDLLAAYNPGKYRIRPEADTPNM
jgi:hypothetical protein